MTWESAYNSKMDVIEIIYEGRLVPGEMELEEERSFALAAEHNSTRFLVDLTNYEGSLPTAEIYNGPRNYDKVISRPIRIAVIEPITEAARADARFYETVCINRGWNTKLFESRELGIEWLIS